MNTRPARVRGVVFALTVSVIIGFTGTPHAVAATNWGVGLTTASKAQAQSQSAPPAPGSITATCISGSSNTVNVTWPSVVRATNYAVYQATAVGGPYTQVTTVATTSYTTGGLSAANYWFKVAALTGTNWISPQSVASAQRSVTVFLFVFWSCS